MGGHNTLPRDHLEPLRKRKGDYRFHAGDLSHDPCVSKFSLIPNLDFRSKGFKQGEPLPVDNPNAAPACWAVLFWFGLGSRQSGVI
jgi:hypothetical protein